MCPLITQREGGDEKQKMGHPFYRQFSRDFFFGHLEKQINCHMAARRIWCFHTQGDAVWSGGLVESKSWIEECWCILIMKFFFSLWFYWNLEHCFQYVMGLWLAFDLGFCNHLQRVKLGWCFQSVHNVLMWFSPSSLININTIYHTALCCISTDSLSILTCYSVSVIITLYCFH